MSQNLAATHVATGTKRLTSGRIFGASVELSRSASVAIFQSRAKRGGAPLLVYCGELDPAEF